MGCGDGLWEAAGAAATPAAFNLGLCRLRGSYPPPAAAKTIHYSLNDGAAGGPFSTATTRVMQRFPILGLKSRIDAVQRPFLSFSLHRFPSLGLKSRITARKMAFSGKTMHRFPSLGLKSRINARKMAFPGKTLHRFASLALKSRITAAVGPFLRVSLQRFPN